MDNHSYVFSFKGCFRNIVFGFTLVSLLAAAFFLGRCSGKNRGGGVRRCPGAKKRIFSPEKPEDTGPLTYFNDKMARRNMGKRLAENA